MPFQPLIERVLAGESFSADLSHIPYFATMGWRVTADAGAISIVMPYQDALIGSPFPPRLHGGTLGALLEIAGTLETVLALARSGRQDPPLPKPIGLTVDFLREGKTQDTFASATVTRLGRRVANVRAQAWQADKASLVAAAHLHLLVEE
jgi:acyl-coenzyme A thioesterase PaaI-like protein